MKRYKMNTSLLHSQITAMHHSTCCKRYRDLVGILRNFEREGICWYDFYLKKYTCDLVVQEVCTISEENNDF